MYLWLVRHGKSSWVDAGQKDFDRPLNKRGKTDCKQMGRWLQAQTHQPQWVWTSSAARAQTTANAVTEALNITQPVLRDELYHAEPEKILDVLGETPSDVTSVCVVAHNPGLTYLTNMLDKSAQLANLPTFGVAKFKVLADIQWWELTTAHTRLEDTMWPKNLPFEYSK